MLLLVSYISLIMLFLHDRLKLHGGKEKEKNIAIYAANPAIFVSF